MSNILALALQSMHQDSVRLETASVNLANAMTGGYKRAMVSVASTSYAQLSTGSFVAQVEALARQTNSPNIQVHQDSRQGALKSTGQPLDLAIDGTGYFEISTPTGPAYTRSGAFQVDSGGRLVTMQGHPVMGKGGEIVLPDSKPVIDEQGNTFESVKGISRVARTPDRQPLAQLKIVQFERHTTFLPAGQGLLTTDSLPSLVAENELQLRQGYLENSNVSSLEEMVQLMQTMRHFEAMQKVAVGYDEMMGTAIRKLGDLA